MLLLLGQTLRLPGQTLPLRGLPGLTLRLLVLSFSDANGKLGAMSPPAYHWLWGPLGTPVAPMGPHVVTEVSMGIILIGVCHAG